MVLKFTPKTEAELELEGLLPDNTYEAEVLKCEEKTDKKGRDMLAIKLNVIGNEGQNRHIYDNISPHWGGFAVKFREFFESMGQLPMYESGAIEPELLVGQYVTVITGTEKQDDYPAKNVIKAYVTAEVGNAQRNKPAILAEAKAEAEKPNSDLPF